ncbi:MAG TPA: BamA/TamA family outer membrane protein [Bacteroidaceae bacterium]|nr:BamA/TamA family outer membrane protein [Bacteroidaceae bacterium]
MLKKILSALAFSLMTCLIWAQNESEIIKSGWNIGPLPVVGWDSDLGLQYGAAVDFFNYGNGTNYPVYDYKINLELSAYTKGSANLRSYGDFKYLIPKGLFFYDCSYFNAKKYEFFGFNGTNNYYPGSNFALKEIAGILTPDYSPYKTAFNNMHRNLFRAVVSIRKELIGNLNWAIGAAFYHYGIKESSIQGTTDQTTLYNLYVNSGLIKENEKNGGNITQLRAGLIYDSRDHDSDPSKGFNIEAGLTMTPDIIDNRGYSHLGFTFIGCQYIPIMAEKAVLAYRVGVQSVIAGDIPWYFASNINSMFFRKMYTEGLGGNSSLRGINRNAVMGKGLSWLNLECRITVFRFNLINQNWKVATNPFFDAGTVIDPLRGLEQKKAWSKVTGNSELTHNLIYSGLNETIHKSAGLGIKLIMNRNMVISAYMAKAFDYQDGESMKSNIGFNYLF